MFKVGDFVKLKDYEKSEYRIQPEWIGCLCMITAMWSNPDELTRYRVKDFSNSGFSDFKNRSWCELDFDYAFSEPQYHIGDTVTIRNDINPALYKHPHSPGITSSMIQHAGKTGHITRVYDAYEYMFYVKFDDEPYEHDCVWADYLFE